ncbi:MAG: DNA starvation/stationary phase protection protein Dps [Phormidesmis sp.]
MRNSILSLSLYDDPMSDRTLPTEALMVATTSSKTAFYPTRIDLPLDTRQSVVDMLNGTLAATSVLRTLTKQANWNVKGKDFYQLHLLFDEMAGELEEFADMLAERVTALAGTAMGTVRMAASNSILPEYDFDAVGGMEHVAALADRYAAYAKHLREGIAKADDLGDMDTSDLYTEVSRTIDKRLWFLEAHLVG